MLTSIFSLGCIIVPSFVLTSCNKINKTTYSIKYSSSNYVIDTSYNPNNSSIPAPTFVDSNGVNVSGATFSISPELPSGLDFNTSNGAITCNSTSSLVNSYSQYTISASSNQSPWSSLDPATTNITISSVGIPTSLTLNYSSPMTIYIDGPVVHSVTPTVLDNNGETVANCIFSSVQTLPSYLSLDTSTGVITCNSTSGLVSSNSNYTIRVSSTSTPWSSLVANDFSLNVSISNNYTYYTLSSAPTTPIYFDESNTPLSNFCATFELNPVTSSIVFMGYPDNSITINNEKINTNAICSLNFGTSYKDVSSVGGYWMYGGWNYDSTGLGGLNFSSLSSIDFSGLSNLSSVGNGWIVGNFPELQNINFNGLSSLSSVGNNWMYGMRISEGNDSFPKLSSINFEGLNSLESVGLSWFDGSDGGFASLSSIDFSGLSSLSSVGDFWLNGKGTSTMNGGFASLSSINFNGLSSLSSVGNSWLNGNYGGFPNLSSIDFSGLSSLSIITTHIVGDEGWVEAEMGGFAKLDSIYVGGVTWKDGFDNKFCNGVTNSGTIYGVDSPTASSWKKGGIIDWNISPTTY